MLVTLFATCSGCDKLKTLPKELFDPPTLTELSYIIASPSYLATSRELFDISREEIPTAFWHSGTRLDEAYVTRPPKNIQELGIDAMRRWWGFEGVTPENAPRVVLNGQEEVAAETPRVTLSELVAKLLAVRTVFHYRHSIVPG